MMYLSGKLQPDLPAMLSHPDSHYPPAGQPWAADNGRFAKPDAYTDASYLTWLRRLAGHRDRCLFATAPDVVGDAQATLDLSLPMFASIHEEGYPAAFVAQDGLIERMVPWTLFETLFIGGTTQWKLSHRAERLISHAKKHGKWVHMGRVNSLKRFRIAAALGCDSVDGTFLAFGPDRRRPELDHWIADHATRPSLWRETA